MTKRTIAFVINPVAGMGGRVGLKGTDGMVDRARELGASEVSPERARKAVDMLFRLVMENPGLELEVLTAGDPMGLNICKQIQAALETERTGSPEKSVTVRSIYEPDPTTTSMDTTEFCRMARSAGAEMVLFTGGDGTARDVLSGVGEYLPILGVPSGVKMHSGVFTIRPEDAGKAVMAFLDGQATLETREIMDLDEDHYRAGRIRTRLFGYALVPVTTSVQGCKNIVSSADEEFERGNIAAGLREFMEYHPGIYILGAGSTLKDIGDQLGIRREGPIREAGSREERREEHKEEHEEERREEHGEEHKEEHEEERREERREEHGEEHGEERGEEREEEREEEHGEEREEEHGEEREKEREEGLLGEGSGVSLTPLGFDILSVRDGIPMALQLDVNEEMILNVLCRVDKNDRYIVITPIGAQGFILGRGTQVISEKVLENVNPDNIIIVATPGKLAITPVLRVDVGPFNKVLKGFTKVMTGYRRFVLKKIE